MNRGPRSGRKAKGICVEFCGSVFTGGDGIAGARLGEGVGLGKVAGPDIEAKKLCPRIAGDASPGLGGGVPCEGADMLCPGIIDDAEPGLCGGAGIESDLLCPETTGE